MPATEGKSIMGKVSETAAEQAVEHQTATALYMLTQAVAVAFDMGMVTRDEVAWLMGRMAKAAARRGR